MTEDNPWLSRPITPEVRGQVPVLAAMPTTPTTGPLTPQGGVPAPDHADQLPILARRHTCDLWVLGAHGGAGESTLAALSSTWTAADHAWPQPPAGAPARVLLTARSNMRGLRAAQTAATQWAAGLVPQVELVGLAILADAPGRLPRPLRDYALVVAGGVPRAWSVPWIETWRLGDSPDPSTAPRSVRQLVDDLSALLRPGAAGATY